MLGKLVELTPESLKSGGLDPIMHGIDAGWSSLAARRAHNPKVAGSNPAPATKDFFKAPFGAFLMVMDGHHFETSRTRIVEMMGRMDYLFETSWARLGEL